MADSTIAAPKDGDYVWAIMKDQGSRESWKVWDHAVYGPANAPSRVMIGASHDEGANAHRENLLSRYHDSPEVLSVARDAVLASVPGSRLEEGGDGSGRNACTIVLPAGFANEAGVLVAVSAISRALSRWAGKNGCGISSYAR